MKTWNVPDMHCERCVARITNALTEEGIAATVTLADQTVTVEDAQAAQVREILDDLGFEVE